MPERPAAPFPVHPLDIVPLPAYLCDRAGATVYVNPALSRHVGLAADRLCRQGVETLFHPADRQGLGPLAALGVPAEQAVRVRLADGQHHWHRLHSAPAGESGPPGSVVVILSRLQEQREIEPQLQHLPALAQGLAQAQTVPEVLDTLPSWPRSWAPTRSAWARCSLVTFSASVRVSLRARPSRWRGRWPTSCRLARHWSCRAPRTPLFPRQLPCLTARRRRRARSSCP
ncbi:PAS domain S-box protein [Deinococcus multiflagellatus]|uniref:PAS domain S-box protein n=1 Tax=Deinococcus multiflagellatus TaxID=1656887 RepID=A0ABW1ZQR6_9DEIO